MTFSETDCPWRAPISRFAANSSTNTRLPRRTRTPASAATSRERPSVGIPAWRAHKPTTRLSWRSVGASLPSRAGRDAAQAADESASSFPPLDASAPLSLTSLTVSPPTLPSQARGRRPTRGRSRSGTDGARPVVSRARLRTAPHAHSFFFIFARAHAAGVADRVSSLPHHHAPANLLPPRSPQVEIANTGCVRCASEPLAPPPASPVARSPANERRAPPFPGQPVL